MSPIWYKFPRKFSCRKCLGVVIMAFDQNIKERNLLVAFKFNDVMPAF